MELINADSAIDCGIGWPVEAKHKFGSARLCGRESRCRCRCGSGGGCSKDACLWSLSEDLAWAADLGGCRYFIYQERDEQGSISQALITPDDQGLCGT